MEEVKLWAIDGTHATALHHVHKTDSERLFEDILVANPSLLIEELSLIGRQTPTTGGEALDLLGIDGDGRLVVFELKRENLTRDAVTQVIDYSSFLASLSQNTLSQHITERSGVKGIQQIESFDEWYNNSFPGKGLDSLFPVRMYLVGLGADDKAIRMVEFLAGSGVDISLLTFYGFSFHGQMFLAKQVDVLGNSTPTSHAKKGNGPSTAELIREFNARAEELDVSVLVNPARDMIKTNLHSPFEYAAVKKRFRTSFYKQGANGSFPAYTFIELDEETKGIKLGFHPRAIDLILDQFEELDPQQTPFIQQKAGARTTEKVNYEIVIPLNSLEDWENHRDNLTSLTRSVYEAWQEKNSAS